MSTITYCSQLSGEWEPGAYDVTSEIKKTTTPEEFDALVNRVNRERFELDGGGYRLEYGGRGGWNALGRAAFVGNPALIAHIVQIGGNHLLSLGNSNGQPPLYYAAVSADHEGGFLAAKELIRLGADVNLGTSPLTFDFEEGPTTLPGLMPLEVATTLKIRKLLLKRGAIVPEGSAFRARIDRAQEIIQLEIAERRLGLGYLGLKTLPEMVREINEWIPRIDM